MENNFIYFLLNFIASSINVKKFQEPLFELDEDCKNRIYIKTIKRVNLNNDSLIQIQNKIQ